MAKRMGYKMKLRVIIECLVCVFVIVLSGGLVVSAEESTADEVRCGDADYELSMPLGGWNDYVEIPEPEGYSKDELDVLYWSDNAVHSSGYSSQQAFFVKCSGKVGRSKLSKAAQKTFYDKIEDVALGFVESSENLTVKTTNEAGSFCVVEQVFEGGDRSLTREELAEAFFAFDVDHPAYYWLSNYYTYSDNNIIMYTPVDYANASVRKSINKAIMDGANAYKTKADYADNTLDKIAIIHDQIINDVDYAYESDGKTPVDAKWAHSVHGVFSSHKAVVCEGYADTFSMMMNYMDIPNIYLVGMSSASGAGGGGGHAWNQVSADGKKYLYMDLTWDDLGKGSLCYNYFGMPKSDFESTHFAATEYYADRKWLYAPSTNTSDSVEDTYYYKMGYVYDGTDYQGFAKKLLTSSLRFGNKFSFIVKSGNGSRVTQEMGTSNYLCYSCNYKGLRYSMYVGTVSKMLDLSDAIVTFPAIKYKYTGSAIKPEPTVTLNGVKLIKGLNYTVSYSDNTAQGTAKVTVKGCGNFTGSATGTFTIYGEALSECTLSLSKTEYTYSGTSKEPTLTVKKGSTALVKDTDYTVSVSGDTVNAGTVTVTVTGKGMYSGKVTLKYTILPKKITADSIEISDEFFYYDGSAKKPSVTVKDGSKTVPSSEYSVAYKDNMEVGTATVTVTDKSGGNYEVSGALQFRIILDHEHSFTYKVTRKPTCAVPGIGTYTCTVCGYYYEEEIETVPHTPVHVSAVAPTVYAEGNKEHWKCSVCAKLFADEDAVTELKKKDVVIPMLEKTQISACKISGLGTKAWTGDLIEPALSVKYGTKTLKAGKDYTVTFTNNKAPGTAKATITGIGEYTGTVEKTFNIKQVVLKYRAYLQKFGWLTWTRAGIGTKIDSGSYSGFTDDLRMETIQMQMSGIGGEVKYRAYVEKLGWTQWATTADKTTYAGTKGMSKRVEMIQMKTDGQVGTLYDMYYKTYCEKFGWLGWATNGEKSGSAGYARKLEAFRIQFVPKGVKFDKGTKKAFYDKGVDG